MLDRVSIPLDQSSSACDHSNCPTRLDFVWNIMGQSKKWPRWFAVIKKRQTKCLCKSVFSFSNYSKKMRIRCVHQIRSDKTDCQHSARLLQHIAMALDLMSSLCGLVSDTRHFEIQHESPDWDASVQIWLKSHFQNTPKCGLNFIYKSCTF